jgi:hypothetical protein
LKVVEASWGVVGGRAGAFQGPSGILAVFEGRSGAVEGPSGFVWVRSRSFRRRGVSLMVVQASLGFVPLRFPVLALNMVVVNVIGAWFFVCSCLGKHASVCSMLSLKTNSS